MAARLVSYKKSKDENRYSTFGSELNSQNSASNENLTITSSNFKLLAIKKTTKINNNLNNSNWKCIMCQCLCCIKLCRKMCSCCCRSHIKCCCCCNQCCDYDEDDDDIDGNFARVKYEMSQTPNIHRRQLTTQTQYNNDDNNKNKKWNWDDSLRSHSDKFLETLEYDTIDGNKSLRKGLKCVPKIRISVYNGEEANAAEIKNSPPICERDPVFSTVGASNNSVGSNPNIGNSNIGIINNINNNGRNSTSPVASRGSASSDPWPSQSDEDIDRLVALHRNRNSLSSLGVRSDSMASVYSGAGEGRYYTVTVKGQVEFGMQYNYKQGALEIHVVQCKELASVDTKRNRSDPYVKVYLLPDKSKGGKRKTKVKKHTLNPVFDETLKFHMSLSSLESRTLWLTVWHSDMFGRNDFLGEVTIVLQGKVFDNTQPQWYPLQERSEPFDDLPTYKGDIIVGLKFIPPESGQSLTTSGRKFSTKSLTSTRGNSKGGSLHVLVKEAKNLTPVKANGNCDAFCKSYLLPDKNRSSKQKTPVIKRTVNPVWNYTFIYDDVTLAELSERALELTLWDHDRLSSNEFLGGVRFSLGTGEFQNMDSNGKELSLWQNMINRPNFWVEGCLPLRSSLDPTVRITS